jgi:hypothetical protein
MANFIGNLFANEHNIENASYNLDVDELNENSPHCPTPRGAKVTLKPHQETLLYRCIEIENNKVYLNTIPSLQSHVNDTHNVRLNMGVIADRVGSGKSYVVLSLIRSNDITTKTKHVVQSFGMNGMIFESMDTTYSIKTNILVIPHNLPAQWEQSTRDFGCNIKYLMLNKKKVLENICAGEIKVEDYDLIIVTSTFYRQLAGYIREQDIKVQRLIFDEIDNVVIVGCTRINAMFYWFITASYGNLLYPKGYQTYDQSLRRYIYCADGMRGAGFVKSIFTELCESLPKELTKVLILKNTESYVQASLQLPPINRNIIRCMTPSSVQILSGVVDSGIINALNANDVTTAIGMISTTQRVSEQSIISMMIHKLTKELGNLNMRLSLTSQLQYDNEAQRLHDQADIRKKISERTNKIVLIEQRIQQNDFCCICYDNIENKTVVECCQNSFCFKCITLWMNKKSVCPMCKTSISQKELFLVDDQMQPEVKEPMPVIKKDLFDPAYTSQFTKLKNLKKLIKQRKSDPDFKCLLFSCYDNSFTDIVPILDEHGIKYGYIKGRGDVIKNAVNRYKTGDLQVLLINVHDYGSGLNLENTSDVIMFHKFDSEIEKQVIGRAHRFGRRGELAVWYLLHGNE